MSVHITDWTEFDMHWYGRVSKDRFKRDAQRRDSAGNTKSTGEQFSCADYWRVGVGAPDWASKHSDEDISASTAARKQVNRRVKVRHGWEQLMEVLATPSSRRKVLCFWEISRGTRDRPVYAALIELCQDEEILICVDGTVYDPNDPDDETWLDFQFMMANRESRVIQKRAKRSASASVERGEPYGRCPLGYRRTYDPHTGNLVAQVPDPKTVPLVLDIFDWLAAGRTVYWVAKKLHDDGVPTYKARQILAQNPEADVRQYQWTAPAVYQIAKNVAYIGRRRHKGQDAGPATWEPIVDEGVFRAVQRRLVERKSVVGRASSRHWLLSSVPFCGVCGGVVVVRRVEGLAGYGCRHGHVRIAMTNLDGAITKLVVERLSQPENFGRVSELDDAAVVMWQTKLDEAETEMAELLIMVEAGEMSPMLAAASERAIQKKITEAKTQMDAARVPMTVRQIAGPQAATMWAKWDNQQRRALIRQMARITLMPGRGKGVIVPAHERTKVEWLF